jgi:hypothetical protein
MKNVLKILRQIYEKRLIFFKTNSTIYFNLVFKDIPVLINYVFYS